MITDTTLASLLARVGEPVTIFHDQRNEGMQWNVSLTRIPLIHDHFATLVEGLEWLGDHRHEFPDWEKRIERYAS